MSTRFLERALRYLLLVPAVVPLVYIDGLLYPYLTPKTLLFRGSAILALAVVVALVLLGRPLFYNRLRRPVTWIPGILLVSAYVSSLLGTDFYHSFWSIFDRGDGLLTLTSAAMFFYATLLFATDEWFVRMKRVVAITGTIVGVLALLQWLQALSSINIPLIPTPSGRIGGTIGNAAFLAGYLGLTLWITVGEALVAHGRMRQFLFAGVAIQALAIVGTATRGTMLALILACGLAALALAWKGEGRVRSLARVMVVVGLLVLGLFFAFREILATSSFEPVRRVASISLTDATVESRLFLWANLSREARAHPILGVGAEHVEPLFNRIYDPGAIVEEWFDRSHNAFLDYLIQFGVIGLGLFLSLLGASVYLAWQLTQKGTVNERTIGYLALLLLVVYAAQNFFVFDTAITLWLLVMVFAYLIVKTRDATVSSMFRFTAPRPAALVVGGLIALLIVPVVFLPLRANLLLADGYRYHVYDARRSAQSLEKGFALGTYANREFGYQMYEMYTERQMLMLEGEARVIAYRAVRDVLEENFKQYPYDARTAVYLAHVLDVAPAPNLRNDELFREAIAQTIELSPKRIQPRYLLANIPIRQGDAFPPQSAERIARYREAITGLEEYARLVPELSDVRYVLAGLYLAIGEASTAASWAQEGKALYRNDASTARRAAKYYISVESWEDARRFLRVAVQEDNTDYPVLFDLAKVEFLNGGIVRAREIVETLKVKAPGLVESDPQFMAELNAAP